jgi:acetyltransferase-like isoleucine patch superfamily enzyme
MKKRKSILYFVGLFIFYLKGIQNRVGRYFLKNLFKSVGRNVKFQHKDIFTYGNITIGNDVYIGPHATFLAAEAPIIIGDKVLFGPNVSIITGNHPIDLRGRFIYDILEKLPGEDMPVVISDDVWVGAGATILKGSNIGRGAVIAAGAVVNINIPPYAIAGGIPAKIIKYRGQKTELEKHEKLLYGKVVTDFKYLD